MTFEKKNDDKNFYVIIQRKNEKGKRKEFL